jgi:maltooligosyltrehalose trehalohydrolase
VSADPRLRLVPLGASPTGDGACRFLVWAPRAERVEVHLVSPRERVEPLERRDGGYHYAVLEDVPPGSLYFYRLARGPDRPDPASRLQPRGVHGPSQVTEPTFPWTDGNWRGLALADYVTYELHVGTFSKEGTFEGVIPRLDELRDLGITAVELMPVAEFPGSRNWGYDGVHPFAAQTSYGGPSGLKRLVDECHRRGLAVVLDVVYNHLGPEGNYLAEFGPYFTDRYRTPWGEAVNFDGPGSDEVRRYFVENALHWLSEAHVDALRLDAVHAIRDHSARPFLQELEEAVARRAEELRRPLLLVAESSLNDPRLVRPPQLGGFGLDAQWNDDFHHSVHTLLTGEREGYYRDFGALSDLEAALRDGFVYAGRYSAYRGRRHGSSSRDIPAHRFFVCVQNHDQVGNRMLGERLSSLVDLERSKLAAGTLLLSPFLPLLFMGEEYGETAPFLYFVSHGDPALVDAVRRGRREEFAAFGWKQEPPDPQSEETFLRSKLDHGLREKGEHRLLLEFHRELLRLRRSRPALRRLARDQMEVRVLEAQRTLRLRRWDLGDEVVVFLHFGEGAVAVDRPGGRWRVALDSADARWGGPGAPRHEPAGHDVIGLAGWSVVLLEPEEGAA